MSKKEAEQAALAPIGGGEIWNRPRAGQKRTMDGDYFRAHVTINSLEDRGCWEWKGAARAADGYRFAFRNNRQQYAHRFAYELLVGAVPSDKQLDHLCRNRGCVNPDHLEIVTPRVNTMRGISESARNAVKTHCVNGHAFDETNTYRRRGRRYCKKCCRAAKQRYLSKGGKR